MAEVLPGILADLAEAVGAEAALDMALALGGESLHVPLPDNLRSGHPLAEAAGIENARRIAERFTGECLYIPKARRALVRRMARQGLGTAEIASRLGISKSAARRYRQGGQRTIVP